MTSRDVARDILRHHQARWKEEFDAEMAVNYGRDLRHIKYLMKIADEQRILSGIEELFVMWKAGLMRDRQPDVNSLRGWWNRVVIRLAQNGYQRYEERG